MGIVYVCTGSCGGVVTEEMHNSGKTTCATETCEKFGQPLERRKQCESCESAAAKNGEPRACSNCT